MSFLLRSTCLAVLALGAAGAAQAAELGDASVRSYSGQPLSAEIELTELTTQELADLQVRLARPDVYQGANVKMNPALAGANLTIQKRDSRRVLRITTNAPVQAEVLHLYFQLASGGRERVRSVTLWLSPDPNPAPAPAPTALAATPASAEQPGKPAARARAAERPLTLVATASPGKDATAGERQLMGAIERAMAAHGGKVEPREEKRAKAALSQQDIRKEALRHASTADDFKRVIRPARQAAAEQEREPKEEQKTEQKAPQRSFLPSKAELAEAARATRASVAAGSTPAASGTAQPVAGAAPATPGANAAPAGPPADAAMLNKLAELEGKLKTLQAQLGMSNAAGAARISVPEVTRPAAAATPASAGAKAADTAAPAQPATADRPVAASPAPVPSPAPAFAQAAAPDQQVAAAVPEPVKRDQGIPHGEPAGAPPAAAAEAPKPKPEAKKEVAPPPPEPKQDIKISRPKLLTFLFAGSLALLAVFCVIVHVIRKAKLKRSPVVRQSWSRDADDIPARIEPAVVPPAEGRAA